MWTTNLIILTIFFGGSDKSYIRRGYVEIFLIYDHNLARYLIICLNKHFDTPSPTVSGKFTARFSRQLVEIARLGKKPVTSCWGKFWIGTEVVPKKYSAEVVPLDNNLKNVNRGYTNIHSFFIRTSRLKIAKPSVQVLSSPIGREICIIIWQIS